MPHRQPFLALLKAYATRQPHSKELVESFSSFCQTHSACFERSLAIGHFTGSAWLLNKDGTHVLLTHHKKLHRWLQLGGHADGDPDIAAVALREAQEESGIFDLQIEPEIFDIDAHLIPARQSDAAHWHYDVRFLLRACSNEDFAVSGESHALAWVDVTALYNDPKTEPSLRRMAEKSLSIPIRKETANL